MYFIAVFLTAKRVSAVKTQRKAGSIRNRSHRFYRRCGRWEIKYTGGLEQAAGIFYTNL